MDALDAVISRSIASPQHIPEQRLVEVVRSDPELAAEALLEAINQRFNQKMVAIESFKRVKGI